MFPGVGLGDDEVDVALLGRPGLPAGVAENVSGAAYRVVVVEDGQDALALGGMGDDAAIDAFDDGCGSS